MFVNSSVTDPRLRNPKRYGSGDRVMLSCGNAHGPTQLFRPATLPICFWRHERAHDGAFLRSCAMLADVVSEPEGENTNARSLEYPSPLMSPATIGVNGVPDCMRARNETVPTFP